MASEHISMKKIKDTQVFEEQKKYKCDSCGDAINRRGIIKLYIQHPTRVYSSGLPTRMNYRVSLCKKNKCWNRVEKNILGFVIDK